MVNAKIDPDPDLLAQAKDSARIAAVNKAVATTSTIVSKDATTPSAESLQPAKVTRTFTYVPENAADGSNGTRWWADENDAHPWIQFDLGKPTDQVGTCEMAFIFTTTFGHAWQLEKSLDGKKWIPVLHRLPPNHVSALPMSPPGSVRPVTCGSAS